MLQPTQSTSKNDGITYHLVADPSSSSQTTTSLDFVSQSVIPSKQDLSIEGINITAPNRSFVPRRSMRDRLFDDLVYKSTIRAAIELSMKNNAKTIKDIFQLFKAGLDKEYSRNSLGIICQPNNMYHSVDYLIRIGILKVAQPQIYTLTDYGKKVVNDYLKIIGREDLNHLQTAVKISRKPNSNLLKIIIILGKNYSLGIKSLTSEEISSQFSSDNVSSSTIAVCLVEKERYQLVTKRDRKSYALTDVGLKVFSAFKELKLLEESIL